MAPLARSLLVALLLGARAEEQAGPSAEQLFEAARTATTPEQAIPLLQRSAELGLARAQAMLGLAHAQGHGGLSADLREAARWFQMAAAQGELDSAYNLVALCEARPQCIGGNASQTHEWLRLAADQGHAGASFELGNLVLEEDAPSALSLFLRAADAGHAAASYNAAHVLALGRPGISADLTRSMSLFSRAERAASDGKVADDARAAMERLRPRWVAAAESDSSVEETTSRFLSAAWEASSFDDPRLQGDTSREALSAAEARCVSLWKEGALEWSSFERSYALHASYENAHAVAHLRRAMAIFEGMLHGASCTMASLTSKVGPHASATDSPDGEGPAQLGPMRTYLLLSKLTEGSLTLARDDAELRAAAAWHEMLARHPLCTAAYAKVEEDHSCFNDRLAAAITLRRRAAAAARTRAKLLLGEAAKAEVAAADVEMARADALVGVGRAHGQAATKWASSAQTPRVFWPALRSIPWWDATSFKVAAALEEAWGSGLIAEDLRRIGVSELGKGIHGVQVTATGGFRTSSLPQQRAAAAGGEPDPFQRIVSSGAPIRGRPGDDAGDAGVWSEFMLFDGKEWVDERCALASTLCTILRHTAEVAGTVRTYDGRRVGPQGQVTVFRLQPGAHVLPHVGVTNQRLVLQFPLSGWEGVRFRVHDEWRGYERGHAMVFDDSYEHEVVHQGTAPRIVLYAVLHHPDLGVPQL